MKYRKLKGVQDILPPDISVWQFIEEKARKIFRSYGYREIRLPIMESTDVFIRSIGETSDIVEKEMYTFQDKGNRSITLRPEGTAPFVRAYVENHLNNEPAPQKYYYMGPMFRYERPQANRYRQFYQIGAEAMGIDDPKLDAEIISMLSLILKAVGLKELNFEITSIGCKECRPDYIKALKDFLEDKMLDFCSDCGRRFKTNPLRVLDCKVPACVKAKKGSPPVVDYLCKECGDHFDRLKNNLRKLNVPHTINPNLVRGLDYYTKTAFEVSSENLGSQSAVAAGGRYDGMVKEFGGPDAPGIGFAIGMERIIPLIKDSLKTTDGPKLYICPLGDEAAEEALLIAEQLRAQGHWIEVNYDNTSIRSQMRKANKINAQNVIVLGDDELENRKVTIKNMDSKDEKIVNLAFNEFLELFQSGK